MTERDLDRFRRVLEKLHHSALARGRDELKESYSRTPMPTSDEMDFATLVGELSMQSRIHDREGRLLHKIEEALERIENDTYGRCVECDDTINIRRLMVRPLAMHCIPCKEAQERNERTLPDDRSRYSSRSIIRDWA